MSRALKSLRRHWRAALANVLILSATLAVLGAAALLYVNAAHLARQWLSQGTVSLFLKPDLDDAGRQAILERVRNHPLVKGAVLVTPQEGLASLSRRLGGEKSLLEGVDPQSLPYTIDFEVLVDYRQHLRDLVRTFTAIPGVEEVVYTERLLERATQLFQLINALGALFIALISLAFFLIVSQATRNSLYARRDEIEILDLVGATRGLIRSSFVAEGMLIALLGFAVAVALVGACYGIVEGTLAYAPLPAMLKGVALVFLPLPYLAGAGAGAL
ncbi:MAG TPA: permease-like cell division protein FtsX, partial [bacterium]|nr:permease-like cell division protein FtsX [bacterium]